jgi:hypothetical protein
MGRLIPDQAAAGVQPAGARAAPARGLGVGAPTSGPPVPAGDPGLPGVLQEERVDLPASPSLVLE